MRSVCFFGRSFVRVVEDNKWSLHVLYVCIWILDRSRLKGSVSIHVKHTFLPIKDKMLDQRCELKHRIKMSYILRIGDAS